MGDPNAVELPPVTTCQASLGDRSLFPNLRAKAFLNHGAISPPSAAVLAQVQLALLDYSAGGVTGFLRWLPQKERLKRKLASLLGAEPEDFAFVPNTTTGVSNIALCVPWRAGDRIVLFEGDFPANVTPWQQAAELYGLRVDILPIAPFHESAEAGLAALRKTLEEPTRLVATSFVRFQTGLRMPVEAMGQLVHAAGAELFVDGIQGVGAVPLAVEHIDYLACGAHKWLMGLEGIGFLYVAPRCAAALRPRVAGWLSHEDALDFLFLGAGHLKHDRPIRAEANTFELGAMSAVGSAALEASLDLIQQIGTDAIFAHTQRYHDALEPGLIDLGFASERSTDIGSRSASLCVTYVGERPVVLAELAAQMGAQGVALTTPDGRLRFAPHWPNALDEVPFVLARLADCLR